MSDVATPAPAAAPTEAPVVETVSLSKEAHAQLVKDAARASEAQSRADRFEGVLKKNGLLGGSGHFKPNTPATPPTPEEREAAASSEDRKAERGLMGIALDPAFREVLDADPTLRTLLTQNPLAVLPMLAPDALDADDAVTLVKEALLKKKAPATPTTPPVAPVVPPTPPTGAVNPTDKPVDEQVETARKIPNTEHAIAGMLGARIRMNAKK